jgi:hypothetical protein
MKPTLSQVRLCAEIGRMLSAMISRADEFCGDFNDRIREAPDGFIT